MSARSHPYGRRSESADPLTKTRLDLSALLSESTASSDSILGKYKEPKSTPIIASVNTSKVRELEGQIVQAKAREAQLTSTINQLRTHNRDLQQQLEEVVSERAHDQELNFAQLSDLRADLHLKEDQEQRLQKEVKDCRQKHEEARATFTERIRNIEKEKQALNFKVMEAEQQCGELQQELHASQTARSMERQTLESSLEQLEEKERVWQEERNKLQEKTIQFEQAIARANRAERALEAARAQIKANEMALTSTSSLTSHFDAADERKLRQLENEVNHLKSTASNVSLLQEQLHIFQTTKHILEEREQSCRAIEVENENLRQEIESMKELRKIAQSHGKSVTNLIHEWILTQKQNAILLEEKGQISSKLSIAQAEISNLRDIITEKTKEFKILKSKSDGDQHQLRLQEGRLLFANNERQSMKEVIESYEKGIIHDNPSFPLEQLRVAQSTNARLSARIEDLEQEIKSLTSQIKVLSRDNSTAALQQQQQPTAVATTTTTTTTTRNETEQAIPSHSFLDFDPSVTRVLHF